MTPRVSVAQLGARMHYAVPRIFHKAGLVHFLYTDFAANKGCFQCLRFLPRSLQPNSLRKLTSRIPDGVPAERIVAFPSLGIRSAYSRAKAKTNDEFIQANIRAADEFSTNIIRHDSRESTHVYVFDTASLLLMREWSQQGILFIMEQTNAPKETMSRILLIEHEKHPDWSTGRPSQANDALIMMRYMEAWQLADQIVTGSEFVMEGLKECGAPIKKCTVVPYGVDFARTLLKKTQWREEMLEKRQQRRNANSPLRVLCVGSIGLRKGSPYVLAAAKALGVKIQVRMVGSVDIPQNAKTALMQHVDVKGLVPRSDIHALYEWADVFLLPSVCEGSATVTYEALAYGLPVICTPNTGSVVEDGHDGLIIAPSSESAVIEALQLLLECPEKLVAMSEAAFAKSDQMDVAHYGRRLLNAAGLAE